MNNAHGKTILILGNSRLVVFGFRGELIQALVKQGYNVVVSFPNGPFGQGEEESKKYGCKFVETKIDRRGKNPLKDLLLLKKYISLIREYSPYAVLAFTVKCDIYGGIACRINDTTFIPNITGLGKALAEGGFVATITKFLYTIAVRKAKCVFFQNESDKKYFDDNIKYRSGIVLPGSGVNLNKFKVLPYPQDNKIVFTYIARVMKAKGIEEFITAAKYFKQHSKKIEFHVCGYCEEDYKGIMKQLDDDGIIKYHGMVKDVIPYEKQSNCIVLPSFHPEGISNVLLEAAASGRPIITTDHPGCRETVTDKKTGFLVKPHDSQDLIKVMEIFVGLTKKEQEIMGVAGRKKMEKEFDREIVVNAYLRSLEN